MSLTRIDLPRVTIHHLAPKTIGRVFELAIEELEGNPEDQARFRPLSRSIMYKLSLVCTNWSREAFILLWRSVSLKQEDRSHRLLASPALGRYTRQLTLSGPWYDAANYKNSLTGQAVHDVVANLKGIIPSPFSLRRPYGKK